MLMENKSSLIPDDQNSILTDKLGLEVPVRDNDDGDLLGNMVKL